MIGYGTPESRPCQRCTSVPHTSEHDVRSSAEPAGRSGRSYSRSAIGWRGAVITAARMGSATTVYVILERMPIQTAAALWLVAALAAPNAPQPQPYRAAKARKH